MNGPAAVVLSGGEDAVLAAVAPTGRGHRTERPTSVHAFDFAPWSSDRVEALAPPFRFAPPGGHRVGLAAPPFRFTPWGGNRVEAPAHPYRRDSHWLAAKRPDRRDILTAGPAAGRVPARGAGDPPVPLDLVPAGRAGSSSRMVPARSM